MDPKIDASKAVPLGGMPVPVPIAMTMTLIMSDGSVQQVGGAAADARGLQIQVGNMKVPPGGKKP
jgi:hypothetical protein